MGRSKDLATGETRFVNATGDTMTGALTGTSAGFTGDVNIGNNDASNPISKLRLGATLYGAADIVPVSTGHKIGLDFKTDSTGDTTIDPVTRMSISNEGYITKPFQPAFFARGDTNAWTSVSTGYRGYPTYDTPIFNIGSHFNTSNGRFTVPVNGLYYFTFHPYVKMNSDSDGSGYATTEILVNGNTYNGLEVIYGYFNAGDRDQVRTVTSIMSLSAGDYVTTALQANAAAASFYGRGCYFMGYLIG